MHILKSALFRAFIQHDARALTFENLWKDAASEQQRRYSALQETFLSADRLLLTARAGCAKRDEQLGHCVILLGDLEQVCGVALQEVMEASSLLALLVDENARLQQQVVEMIPKLCVCVCV